MASDMRRNTPEIVPQTDKLWLHQGHRLQLWLLHWLSGRTLILCSCMPARSRRSGCRYLSRTLAFSGGDWGSGQPVY